MFIQYRVCENAYVSKSKINSKCMNEKMLVRMSSCTTKNQKLMKRNKIKEKSWTERLHYTIRSSKTWKSGWRNHRATLMQGHGRTTILTRQMHSRKWYAIFECTIGNWWIRRAMRYVCNDSPCYTRFWIQVIHRARSMPSCLNCNWGKLNVSAHGCRWIQVTTTRCSFR